MNRTSVLWVAGVLSLVACRRDEPGGAETSAITADPHGVSLTTDAPQWKYIDVAVATESKALTPLPVPGRVEIDEKRTSNVGSPLAGRVESVQVRQGDRVKKGDRLFSVRSAAWADLDREIQSAQAAVAVKRRIAERAAELLALRAIPEKEAQAADAELKEAELTQKSANAKRSSLAVDGEGDNLFWLVAPRAGTVVELDVYSSQEVTPEREKSLLRISDLDEVLVLADVPENDVGDLKVGSTAQVKTQVGGVVRSGTIDYISEVVDARRRTVEVRLRASNVDRALRPNAFVEVTPEVDALSRVIRVPATATVSDGAKTVVFVATGPNRLEPRIVIAGRRRDGEVELRGGLAAGTSYVSRGALLLLNQISLSQ